MLKENWRFVSRVERLADTAIIVGAFFLAYHARPALVFWNDLLDLKLRFTGDELAPLKDYFIVLIVAMLTWSATLQGLGAYRSMRFLSQWQLARLLLFACVATLLVLAATLFLLKLDLSRSFIVMFCGLTTILLWFERAAVLWALRIARRRGKNFRNVIICGTGEQAQRLVHEIGRRPELGIRVRAIATLNGATAAQELLTLRSLARVPLGRLLRSADEVMRALREYSIDEVIFTDVVSVMPEVEAVIGAATDQGVRTTIAADLFSMGMVRSAISYFGGVPLIHFQTPPGDRWELTLKRMLDVTFSLLLLVALSPLLLLIAMAIKLDSPGPVLFRQRRVGLNGRLFEMLKFRSMFVDAEQQLQMLRDKNEMSGPVFKMTQDPRVTRVGAFLRRFSLDELPQLWNVFRGEMSLVGPRPPVPGEVNLYDRKDRRRLSMRPGLTCTWQVSGRNEISDFQEWVKLDLEYIDNWSLQRDLVLMVRTIPAVLFGTGAR